MKKQQNIPLTVPNLSGNEIKYVTDCIKTGWISSAGSYVEKFEERVKNYTESKYGIATVNGTSALHIALKLMNIKNDDYVIIPNLTFVATANAVKYLEAEPILIDIDPIYWQIDLDILEEFLLNNTIIKDDGKCYHKCDNKHIAAILTVNMQGNMGDIYRLLKIGKEYNIEIIEDAAESLGTTFDDKHAGTFGRLGCLSFNGNKIISSGGGGLILTDNQDLASEAKHLTTTAKTDPFAYFHDKIGYNYRLVNILAAIGLAQMEQLDNFLIKKKYIGNYYYKNLSNIGDIEFQGVLPMVDHNNWLYTIKTTNQKKLIDYLNKNYITCRPIWTPMNHLPMYSNCLYITETDVSNYIFESCLSIPCSTNILDVELERVVDTIKDFYEKNE